MSSQNDVVECFSCRQVPDNYLCLNCQHCFCLMCMAQNFLRGGRIYQKPQNKNLMYICSICEEETELDEASVSAIDIILHQILIPCLDQINQPSNSQYQNQKVILEDSQENETVDFKTPEVLMEEVRPEMSQIQDESCKQKEHFDSIYAESPTSRQNQLNEEMANQSAQQSEKAIDSYTHCEKHQNEDITLFCFSCETKCFCVQCLIQSPIHKTHDVQNVQISMKKLKSRMNEANHTIAASIEILNLQKKRIFDQDQVNVNQIDEYKKSASAGLDILMKCILQKKNQLINEMQQLQIIQQQQTGKLINEITLKINTLSNLKNDFSNISVNKSDSLQPSASLFNFFADCKQILQKVVGQINLSELLQQDGVNIIKYFPDYKEFLFNMSEFDEKVKLICESVENITQKSQIKSESIYATQRSYSLHEKNWEKEKTQQTAKSSVSKKCTTQADDDDQNLRVKSQVSVKINGKLHESASMQYYFEKTFSKKQRDLGLPSFYSKNSQKSILDGFKNSQSERVSTISGKEDSRRQQKKIMERQFDKQSQIQQQVMNIKRSYSELSPKLQISPYFKIERLNPLNVLRQQQGKFDKTKDIFKE